jgi:Uma2 family endonuclease
MSALEISDEDVERSIDQRVVLYGISFSQYEAALAMRGKGSIPRIAYLDGELELMTPSFTHEEVKTSLARLLEAYAEEMDIDLTGAGSWTLKSRAKKSGIEPDECYLIGGKKKVPDLAIEVVHTSGTLDKLELYRRLGVREVWFWRRGELLVHVLTAKGYEQRSRSDVLPHLDLGLLTSFVLAPNQTKAVKAFRAVIRGSRED